MTITTAQLDELDAKATGWTATGDFGLERTELDGDDRTAIVQLIRIARAALAWSEARSREERYVYDLRVETRREKDAATDLVAALDGTP